MEANYKELQDKYVNLAKKVEILETNLRNQKIQINENKAVQAETMKLNNNHRIWKKSGVSLIVCSKEESLLNLKERIDFLENEYNSSEKKKQKR